MSNHNQLIVFSVWGKINSAQTLSGLPFFLCNELKTTTNLIIEDKNLEFDYSFKNKVIFHTLHKIEYVLFKLLKINLNFQGAKLSWCFIASLKLKKIIEKYPQIPVLTFGIAPLVFGLKGNKNKLFAYIDGIYSYKSKTYLWTKSKTTSTEKWIYKFIESRFLDAANNVFVTSETIKQSIVSTYPNQVLKIKNVSIGANLQEVVSLNKPKTNTTNILFIYTDFYKKGGKTILEIIQKIDNPNFIFHMVGTKPENILEPKNSVWHGYIDKVVDEKKYAEVLENCHINLMPSHGDLTPHVICECNAYGIPTIANDVGGIKDLVGNGGELVAGYEPEVYIAALNKINLNLRQRSQLCFQTYSNEQKWSLVAKKISLAINN